jgi:hypothetical protein
MRSNSNEHFKYYHHYDPSLHTVYHEHVYHDQINCSCSGARQGLRKNDPDAWGVFVYF